MSMIEIGSYLKKERKKQNLSLEDVAHRTKIHLTKLRAIEEGNREALPAKVFCVGLIKSYARELGVDMQKVNRLCEEAFKETVETVEEPPVAPQRVEADDTSESQPVGLFQIPKFFTYIAGLILILSLLTGIFFVVEKLQSYSREEALPEEVFLEIKDDKEAVDSLLSKSKELQPKAPTKESSSKEKSKPETKIPETQILPAEKKDETPAPKGSTPTQNLKPIQKESKEDDKDMVEDTGFSDKAATTVVSDNKLIVTALEPIRVEVVWSDGYVQVMLLKSQETKTLIFSSPIKLRINNGGAVQVSFNDGEKKVPGTFNQPIEIQFP